MSEVQDLVEQLRKRRRRPNGGGGGGAGGPPGGGVPSFRPAAMLIAFGILLVVWGVLSSFYTVQPEERAVVKRFGKVRGIADPGLHFKLPFGVDSVQPVATERVLKQEFGFRTEDTSSPRSRFSDDIPDESLMLTGDLNIIQVEWVVQYRIENPINFLYGMRNPTQTLRDISESVMRRVVGNRVGSEVLTVARVDIANTARDEIQEAMEEYGTGIRVITVELQDVVPPPRVQPAFNEVNEARQERERMINEAMRQANQAIPRAQGTAQRIIAEAEGYAAERVNRAHGEAARFTAVLAEYRNAPEVTRSRLYLETVNELLPRVGSIVVTRSDGGQIPPVPLLNLRDASERRPAQAQQPTPPPQQRQPDPAPTQQPERSPRNIGRTR